MTMNKALHTRDDVDILYESRKDGGRRLASSEDSVDASIQRLEDNRENRWGRLTAIRNNTDNMRTNRTTISRKQKCKKTQLYGRFKRLISDILHKKTWTWLRKRNRWRGSESLLTAAQNNAIRTTHIKVRIDKTQQNSRCRLCSDRDKATNLIISEYSKLVEKDHKTRYDWVGKVIHWELCKKFKFAHMNKWYMNNPESAVEKDTHKLLWDFDIQTDYLISA